MKKVWSFFLVMIFAIMLFGCTSTSTPTTQSSATVAPTPVPTSTPVQPTPSQTPSSVIVNPVSKALKPPVVVVDNLNDLLHNGCRIGETCSYQISVDMPLGSTGGQLIFDPNFGDVQKVDLTGGLNTKTFSILYQHIPGYTGGSKDLRPRVRATATAPGGLTSNSQDVTFTVTVVGYDTPNNGDITSQTAVATNDGHIKIDWTVTKDVTKTRVEVTDTTNATLVDSFDEVHPVHSALLPVTRTTTTNLTAGRTYRIKLTPINAADQVGTAVFTQDIAIVGLSQARFTATADDSGNILTNWPTVDRASGYRIDLRNTSNNVHKYYDLPSIQTSFTIPSADVPYGYSYEVTIQAKDSAGQYGPVSESSIVDLLTLPQLGATVRAFEQNVVGFQSKLQATVTTVSTTTGNQTVTTNPVSKLATSLRWYFTTPGNPFAIQKVTGPTELTTNLENLQANTTYYVTVSQCRDGVCSPVPSTVTQASLDANQYVGHATTGPLLGTLSQPSLAIAVSDDTDPTHAAKIQIGTSVIPGVATEDVRYTVVRGPSSAGPFAAVPGLTAISLPGADPQISTLIFVRDGNLQPSNTYYWKVLVELWSHDGNQILKSSALSGYVTLTTPCAGPGQTCTPTPAPAPVSSPCTQAVNGVCVSSPSPTVSSSPQQPVVTVTDYKPGAYPGVKLSGNDVTFDHINLHSTIKAVRDGGSTIEDVSVSAASSIVAQRWGSSPATLTCSKVTLDSGASNARVVPYCSGLKTFFAGTDKAGTVKLVVNGITYWVKNTQWVISDAGVYWTRNSYQEQDKLYF